MVALTKGFTAAEADDFLKGLTESPDQYILDLIYDYSIVLSDALKTVQSRLWTRGEVFGFFHAVEGLNLLHHQSTGQLLAMLLMDDGRMKAADQWPEDPDTWCDRCEELGRDAPLGVALVALSRAWERNKNGIVTRWVDELPRERDYVAQGLDFRNGKGFTKAKAVRP